MPAVPAPNRNRPLHDLAPSPAVPLSLADAGGIGVERVLQPVLGSVSELHELSHGAASVHDISETGAPDEEGNAAGTLHVMHHLAHCCGHVVPTPAAPLVLPRISHSEPTNLTDSRLVPSGRWLAPFRPPISA